MKKILYSFYSDRASKRFYTHAKNREQARMLIYKRFRKEFPNTNCEYILLDNIRKEK